MCCRNDCSEKKGNIVFNYDKDWIEHHNIPISLSLPCEEPDIHGQRGTAFFENLLPEEKAFLDICSQLDVSPRGIYEILRVFGRECAGALVVAPAEVQHRSSDAYVDVAEELEELLFLSGGAPRRSLMVETDAKLSLAGAQNKLPVFLKDDHILVPAPASLSPTTAILKTSNRLYPHLLLDEHFCMSLAGRVGIPAAPTEILALGGHQVLIVYRYDRKTTPGGIARIHQEDFCQALGLPRTRKYEKDKGPGFADCAKILRHVRVANPVKDRENFLRCIFFNFIIGNYDAHGKNFSLLHSGTGSVSLAPFYDLVSSDIYPDLTKKFAMSCKGIVARENMSADAWVWLAGTMSIRPRRMADLMDELTSSIKKELPGLIEQHKTMYGHPDFHDALAACIGRGLHLLRTTRPVPATRYKEGGRPDGGKHGPRADPDN